ncbi:MAG: ferrous iron transport protein A [Synergistales bacterium]|nr:ferrous iron transport protein A [Synergistales bacterium]
MSTIRDIPKGSVATVTSLPGGQCRLRLEALGLRVGKTITKVSGMPFRGPTTLLLDGRQIAIGHGAAGRVEVSVIREGLESA